LIEHNAGTPPSPRFGHSATYLPAIKCLVIVGGKSGYPQASPLQVHLYDVRRRHWRAVTLNVTPIGAPWPQSRVHHSACALGPSSTQIIILGGLPATRRYSRESVSTGLQILKFHPRKDSSAAVQILRTSEGANTNATSISGSGKSGHAGNTEDDSFSILGPENPVQATWYRPSIEPESQVLRYLHTPFVVTLPGRGAANASKPTSIPENEEKEPIGGDEKLPSREPKDNKEPSRIERKGPFERRLRTVAVFGGCLRGGVSANPGIYIIDRRQGKWIHRTLTMAFGNAPPRDIPPPVDTLTFDLRACYQCFPPLPNPGAPTSASQPSGTPTPSRKQHQPATGGSTRGTGKTTTGSIDEKTGGLNLVRLVSRDGGSVLASREILQFRSEYFKRMFQGYMREAYDKEICFSDIKYTLLVTIVHYLHCGDLPRGPAWGRGGDSCTQPPRAGPALRYPLNPRWKIPTPKKVTRKPETKSSPNPNLNPNLSPSNPESTPSTSSKPILAVPFQTARNTLHIYEGYFGLNRGNTKGSRRRDSGNQRIGTGERRERRRAEYLNDLLHLLVLADRYQISGLRAVVANELKPLITTQNALDVFQFSLRHNCVSLRLAVVNLLTTRNIAKAKFRLHWIVPGHMLSGHVYDASTDGYSSVSGGSPGTTSRNAKEAVSVTPGSAGIRPVRIADRRDKARDKKDDSKGVDISELNDTISTDGNASTHMASPGNDSGGGDSHGDRNGGTEVDAAWLNTIVKRHTLAVLRESENEETNKQYSNSITGTTGSHENGKRNDHHEEAESLPRLL